MLIDAVLCLQSQFKDMAILHQGYCHCMPFEQELRWTMIETKMYINLVLLSLSGKAKLSMDSCLFKFGATFQKGVLFSAEEPLGETISTEI